MGEELRFYVVLDSEKLSVSDGAIEVTFEAFLEGEDTPVKVTINLGDDVEGKLLKRIEKILEVVA